MTRQLLGKFRSLSCGGRLLVVVLLAIVVVVGRPTLHLITNAWQDADALSPPKTGYLDDASRLNSTPVTEVWRVPTNPTLAEEQLARLLKHARSKGLRVSIAGARHTMGGHTIYPGGVVIDMLPFRAMQLDSKSEILQVQAGALWSDVIPYLDARRRSVAVMQSNNSFSVGGSISANCHGWQYGRPPIASTVERFRIMLADGSIVTCSRDENDELFALALGGYGLFGVILDVQLRTVPNECYRLEQSIVSVDAALDAFDQATHQGEAAMAYARMGIAPERFLEEVIVNVLYRDSNHTGPLPTLAEPGLVSIRRNLFRGSAASEYGKRLRWQAEVELQPKLRMRYYSRNQLLNEGVEVFENRSPDFTDVLHEYFVPREGLVPFVASLREIIPRHQGDLLNVTVRSVEADDDTVLRYADRPMFSFVMLFFQPRTEEGDLCMCAMTRELVEAALQAGGRFYLPYRLHATKAQFERAYPSAEKFFAMKRKYDRAELFQNRFYLKYARP